MLQFESKLGSVDAAKLEKKLIKKVMNKFSARPNKNIKPIYYCIIEDFFLSEFYMKQLLKF